MKYFLSVIIVLTFSISGHAKKFCYPIEVVAGMADLIVVGKIEKVSSGSYQFRISTTVKGQVKDLIKVQKFEEWTCDKRMKKAKKGQELFLFLTMKAEKYEIINGSTGEMFIENGVVQRVFNTLQPKTADLITALKAFTSSFKYKGKDYDTSDKNFFFQLKTDKEIRELSAKTRLTSWFFDRVKEYEIKK
ncbi:MAG: hypothetical protein ACI8ZM_001777 [Crocinitomix sp.]|jgi:hypothetical protein